MSALLEHLSPMERAVFILRETVDYDYRDIAELLDKSDAAAGSCTEAAKQAASIALPGLLMKRNGSLYVILSFQFDSKSRPGRLFMVTNPDKLRQVTLNGCQCRL